MGKCLMIVGMHRSGTSLTSSILQKAGLFIGDELMEAGEANKKGHFENIAFYNFQVKAFNSLSLDIDGWDLKAIDHLSEELDKEAFEVIRQNDKEEWGWKEPRTTLFMKYWENKIPTINYLFVYRNPWDVADSLFRRGNDPKIMADPELAFKAWDFYNREIIEMYKKHKEESILIHIDDIIKDIPALINQLNSRFGMHLNAAKIGDIFDRSLYQSSDDNDYRSWQTSAAYPEIMNTLNELRALTGKGKYEVKGILDGTAVAKDWLEASQKDKKHEEQIQFLISDWHKVWVQKKEIKMLNFELDNRNREIAWMKQTKFWKLREFWMKLRGKK
jgi:hypothetical protein